MKAISVAPVSERTWLTYTKAAIFVLPAMLAWSFACTWLMPKAKEICEKAGFEPSHLGHSGWIWPATFLLADWGRTLLVAAVLALALVELVAPRWWRRRVVVGIGVWVANLAVLFALCVLLTIVLIATAQR